MYGAPVGDVSLQQLLSRFSENPTVADTPVTDLISALDVPGCGKLKQPVVEAMLAASPNATLLASRHRVDPGKPPLARHTRDASVVACVNSAFWAAPGKRKRKTKVVAEVNKWIYYQGSEQGWQARYTQHGCNAKTPLAVRLIGDDAVAALRECMPLNSVHSISLLADFYKPNLEASAGLPNPEKSKRDELPGILRVLIECQAQKSFEPITKFDDWATALFMLKSELHDVNKLLQKARAYFCYPAVTSMAVGCFLAHFTSKLPTFIDRPSCTNLVGLSLYHGGADALLSRVEGLESSAAAFYGDDGLIVIVFPSKRRWIILPDVASMDTNTHEAFKGLWLKHVDNHFCSADEREVAYHTSAMSLYNTILHNSTFVFPRGVQAKLTNFTVTGMVANTHVQTMANSVIWKMVLEPKLTEMAAAMDAGADKSTEAACVKQIVDELAGLMVEVGQLPWKLPISYYRYRGRIDGLLGHNIWRDTPQSGLAALPEERLLSSLLNPRKKPNKSGSAVLLAYSRGIALAGAGGYAYEGFMAVLGALRERSVQLARTLQPEHQVALSQFHPQTELDLAGDDVPVPPVFRIAANGFEVLPVPTVAQFEKLRKTARAGGLTKAWVCLLQKTWPAKAAPTVQSSSSIQAKGTTKTKIQTFKRNPKGKSDSPEKKAAKPANAAKRQSREARKKRAREDGDAAGAAPQGAPEGGGEEGGAANSAAGPAMDAGSGGVTSATPARPATRQKADSGVKTRSRLRGG